MESMTILATITTTSNKQSTEFKAETPSKTAYLHVDEANKQKLIDFGLTMYTPKTPNEETGEIEDYFIVKLTQSLKLYKNTDKKAKPTEFPCGITEPNFFTDEALEMNIIKGEKSNNEFFRLNAIKVNRVNNLQLLEASNPFAEQELATK